MLGKRAEHGANKKGRSSYSANYAQLRKSFAMMQKE
tara:strand:- start:29 stop:136 length:108 start_codon:yes stop_codon:yes gene_type:complete